MGWTGTTLLLMMIALQETTGAPLEVTTLNEDLGSLVVITNAEPQTNSTMTSYAPVTDAPRGLFSKILEINKENPLLDGDIVNRFGRSAVSCTNCYWPISSTNMVFVPYVISPNYSASARTAILRAMGELMTLSCVRFVQRTTEISYVDIYSGDGCWSVLGRTGGKQALSLSNDCIINGIIQHELFHALAFTHEINRSDRDQYIQILTENIKPDQLYQFNKENTNNLNLPYDYHSVMHFDRYAYSSNGLATIEPLFNKSDVLGQNDGVSPLDVAKLNTLYNCNLCRSLLDGNNGYITSTNYPSQYPSCLYLIRVPEDQVFVSFQSFAIQTSPGCTSYHLRVYDGYNTSAPVLLDNACGNSLPPSLVASSNALLFEYVRDGALAGSGFKASYSKVTCGASFLQNNGVITSPYYPFMYPNLQNCVYSITAPVGYKISLTFTTFKLALASADCVSAGDYVVVYNGPGLDSPVLGKFCSYAAIPPPQMSTGNSMVLNFQSDSWMTYIGFRATYSFVPNN